MKSLWEIFEELKGSELAQPRMDVVTSKQLWVFENRLLEKIFGNKKDWSEETIQAVEDAIRLIENSSQFSFNGTVYNWGSPLIQAAFELANK